MPLDLRLIRGTNPLEWKHKSVTWANCGLCATAGHCCRPALSLRFLVAVVPESGWPADFTSKPPLNRSQSFRFRGFPRIRPGCSPPTAYRSGPALPADLHPGRETPRRGSRLLGPSCVCSLVQTVRKSSSIPNSRSATLVSSTFWLETPPSGAASTVTVNLRPLPLANLDNTLV